MGFPGDSAVKNLPAKQETQVGPLGREDPLEEGMATHSSILAWRISWTEEPGGLQSIGSGRSQTRLSYLNSNNPAKSTLCTGCIHTESPVGTLIEAPVVGEADGT